MNKLIKLNFVPIYAVVITLLYAFSCSTSSGAQGATMTDLILSLEQVESNGNEIAYNESEKALGCLQIRPIMLADYNRIYGTSFTHDQMKSRSTSHLVAIGIFHHYGKSIKRNGGTPNAKHLAFIWNGGGSAWKRVDNPKRDQKQNNLEIYWTKVSKHLP
jgi:hypothetical protein